MEDQTGSKRKKIMVAIAGKVMFCAGRSEKVKQESRRQHGTNTIILNQKA